MREEHIKLLRDIADMLMSASYEEKREAMQAALRSGAYHIDSLIKNERDNALAAAGQEEFAL